MAENEISDYLETDNDNTDIAGISVQENVMRPPAVNNAFRALQGALKRWFKTSLFRLRDSTDQTKLLAFDLSGITTGTTRTHKAPNYNGTLQSQAMGSAIASATSIDLGAASGSTVHVTGTTTITALGTADAGVEKSVVFDGALTLTHNATSLILAGSTNIATAAGDTATFVSEGSGNWRCTAYQRAAAAPTRPQAWEQIGAEVVVSVATAVVQWTGLGAYKYLRITGIFLPGTNTAALGMRFGVSTGDSGANYDYQIVRGSSGAVDGPVTTGQTIAGATGGVGSASGREASLDVVITNFNKAAATKWTSTVASSDGSGNLTILTIGGRHTQTTANAVLELVASAGQIAAGSSFVLEGLRG